MFTSPEELLFRNLKSSAYIFIPLIILFGVNVIIDLMLSENINFTCRICNPYNDNTGPKSPLALATDSFPGHELISIALIIGP